MLSIFNPLEKDCCNDEDAEDEDGKYSDLMPQPWGPESASRPPAAVEDTKDRYAHTHTQSHTVSHRYD